MTPRTVGMLTLLALAALPAGADAQNKREKAQIAQARRHYDKAREHYNLGEYDQAIAEFKEAYRLWKQPLFLFDIGQAYRLSGDCAQAITFYKSYLREAPNPDNRAEVDKGMAVCASATKPAPRDEPSKQLEAPPPAPPLPTPAPAPESTSRSFVALHRGSVVAGGAAVVLGGVGMALSVSSWLDYKDLADRCVGVPCPEDDIDALDRKVLYTNIAWGAAGAAAITSAILYVWFEKDTESLPRAAVVPTTHGASVLVRF